MMTKMKCKMALLCVIVLFHIFGLSACSQEVQTPTNAKTWEDEELGRLELASTNLGTGRTAHTATLLTDGRVLVVGGSTDARAEILDQNGANPQFTGALSTNRLSHAAMLLQNGNVWVVGGVEGVSNYLASTELFDPAIGTFSAGPNLTTARKSPTLNLLRNGKVLVCGGQSSFSGYLNTCDLYDPTGGIVTAVPGTMQEARAGHTAVLLQDGNVLICGGLRAASTPNATCDRYNADSNNLTAVQPMNAGRAAHTATVLADGRVLVVGGRSVTTTLASAEIYDPNENTWSDGGSLSQARQSHSATLLPDGSVVVAGGYSGSQALNSVEIYTAFAPQAGEPCSFGAVNADAGGCDTDLICIGLHANASSTQPVPCTSAADCTSVGGSTGVCAEAYCGVSWCAEVCTADADCTAPGYGGGCCGPVGSDTMCYISDFCGGSAGDQAAGEPCTFGVVNADAGGCDTDLSCIGLHANASSTIPAPCAEDADCKADLGSTAVCAGGYCGVSWCAEDCTTDDDCTAAGYGTNGGCCGPVGTDTMCYINDFCNSVVDGDEEAETSYSLPTPGDVIFTEFLANTTGSVAEQLGEWLEIYNMTDETLSLGGLTLCDSSDANCEVLPMELMIGPNETLLFAGSANPAENGGLTNVAYDFAFSLNNSGDALRLFDGGATGTLINSVDATTWSQDAGYSWQLDVDYYDPIYNDDAVYWCHCANEYVADGPHFGTPGAMNVSCTVVDGDVVDGDVVDGDVVLGDCCTPHETGGCSDTAINDCVCFYDSWCCDTIWDAICMSEVEFFECGSCGGTDGDLDTDEESDGELEPCTDNTYCNNNGYCWGNNTYCNCLTPFAGATCDACAPDHENYPDCLITCGGGLSLLATIDLNGNSYGAVIKDGYLIVAEGETLVSYLLLDMASPVMIDSVQLSDSIFGLARKDNYVYATTNLNGLGIVDVSDPANLGTPIYQGDLGQLRDLAIAGNYAYTHVLFYGFHIVDISTPTSPSKVNFVNISGATGLDAVGNYVYVAWRTLNPEEGGLAIVEVSDPNSPGTPAIENTETVVDDWKSASKVNVNGSYAFVANRESGLAIIDVDDPVDPGMPTYVPGISAELIHVQGGVAYVGGYSGFRTVDVTNPAAPGVPNDLIDSGNVSSLNVQAGYLLHTNAIDSKLQIWEITCP